MLQAKRVEEESAISRGLIVEAELVIVLALAE
jgi:hypothetical protein